VIKGYLEDSGLTVYVDCYTNPHLCSEEVTKDTAEILRSRLRASQSLLYAYSRHSKLSRWMPCELGFMGGDCQVGIAPVVKSARDTFDGEQHLGRYPYLDRETISGENNRALWINRGPREYAEHADWVRGTANITVRGA
jgi:hypothetical protein